MLDKCTNPSCSAAFRYLQQGSLFRVECDPAFGLMVRTKPQYFWLCPRCSERMTLQLACETTVKAVPFIDAGQCWREDVAFVPLEKDGGLLLSVFKRLGRRPASGWRSSALRAYSGQTAAHQAI